ncbi:MAG: S8 family serine peptidase [Planctomycetota bacterium]|nr:S8 family serine peptidase [Planctomycetota bacterium]
MGFFRWKKRRRFNHSSRVRPGESGRLRRAAILEALEERILLNADPVLDYNRITPVWFETVHQPNGPSGSHGSVLDRWTIRLTEETTREVNSVQDVGPLLNGRGIDFRVLRGLGLPGQVLIEAPCVNTAQIIASLSSNPHIASFSPDLEIYQGQVTPDDSLFGQQFSLDNIEQSGGKADADIDAPEAWDIFTTNGQSVGDRSMVVGLVDSGIDYTHPDLYLNIWLNPGELPAAFRDDLQDVDADGLITFVDLQLGGPNAQYVEDLNSTGYIDAGDLLLDSDWANGTDEDLNGKTDDLIGWDFVNNDNDPWDDNSHGTHVGGIIGAMGGNARGVTGVAWETSLMVLKNLSALNKGTPASGRDAINYATMMGSDFGINLQVLNTSWGGFGGFDRELRDSIERAGDDADILIVAAAGNGTNRLGGRDTDAQPFYPAGYDLDNIISVASTDHNDLLAFSSNFGRHSVDIAAPGVGINSTVPRNPALPFDPDGDYYLRSGTSMAAPHVSGVAALVWSRIPTATAAEVREAILESADSLDSLRNKVDTSGRLNALAALTIDTFAPQASLSPDFQPLIESAGSEHTIGVVYEDDTAISLSTIGEQDVFVRASQGAQGTIPARFDRRVAANGKVLATYIVDAPGGTWDFLDNGTYEIFLRSGQVSDLAGNFARAQRLGSFTVNVSNIGEIRVNTTADTTAADAASGPEDANGSISLRSALMHANASGQEKTILLDVRSTGTQAEVVYRLTLAGDDDTAELGDLDVLGSVTIIGLQGTRTIIDARADLASVGIDRIFDVHANATFQLHYVSLQGGETNEDGGAIRNVGTLSFVDSTLEANQAANGGGISSTGQLQITRSLLVDNHATANGSGLYNSGSGVATIRNSTFSANQSDIQSGAISGSSSVSLQNVTITENRGGGITNLGNAAAFQLRNTIVAANTHGGTAQDLQGAFNSLGSNLIGIGQVGSGFTDGVNGDQVGNATTPLDAGLFPLADNLGPTRTHALAPESPARNAGSAIGAPTVDQRGFPRPTDGGGLVDIGAFERFYVEIQGLKFHDANGNGLRDGGEPGLAGWTIYLDLNNNGRLDASENEPAVQTQSDNPATSNFDETGLYTFDDSFRLLPGEYRVMEVPQANYIPTLPRDLNFTPQPAVGTGAFPAAVVAADFDNDRSVDIAIANRLADQVSIILNNGDGGFATIHTIDVGERPTALATGDVNGDGDVDLFVANESSGDVSLLLGRGDGTFEDPTSLAQGTKPVALALADFDNDGAIDLALASADLKQVKIFFNDQGTFVAAVSYTFADSLLGLAVADIDGQNGPDLIVTKPTTHSLTILRNDGNRAFTQLADINSGGLNPSSITTGDFNADGKPDLAVANRDSHSVAVMLNLGDARFDAPLRFDVADGPVAIVAADFDNDGALDLATANQTDSSISVLINKTDAPVTVGGQSVLDLTVNSTADEIDTNPGNGVVDTVSGNITLRAAIMEANAHAGDDVITLPAGVYTLTIAPAGTNDDASGDLNITGQITIVGAGAGTTTIDGNNLDRVLNIGASGIVDVFALTITRGRAGGATDGGGILNSGALTLTNIVVDGNTATDEGGGIYNGDDAVLTVTSSTISNNSATDHGGGIFTQGGTTVQIADSTISNNQALSGLGGGVFNNGGDVTIRRSTLSANHAGTDGGAALNNFIGTLTIINSTISANTAGGDGGGIRQIGSGSTTLQNATVTNNSATNAGGVLQVSGAVNVINTIIAGNTATSSHPDVMGVFTSQGHNLIGNVATATGFTNGSKGDQVGSSGSPLNPLLGPLSDNGGPTLTHALLPGSPAVDTGDDLKAPLTDQRGLARPLNGDNLATAISDVGAVEVEYNSSPVLADTDLFDIRPRNVSAAENAGIPVTELTRGVRDANALALSGIAITATNEALGTVQYSADGGVTWNNVGAVSLSSALLLPADANNRVRFQPIVAFSFSVNDAVTLRAWDQTTGTPFTKVDTATNGGATPFSTATDTAAFVFTSTFWDGGGDGTSWRDAANWNNDTLPGSGSNVLVDVPGEQSIVHSLGSTAVSRLLMREDFTLSGGSLTVSGTLQAEAALLLTGGAIIGGTVLGGNSAAISSNGGTLDGVTLEADLTINSRTQLTIENGITLNGTMTLFVEPGSCSGGGLDGCFTRLYFSDSQTLDGTGDVVFSGGDPRKLVRSLTGTLTIGPNITIHGEAGIVGEPSLPSVNQGTILSDVSATITVTGDTLTHTGELRATAGSVLSVNDLLSSSGRVTADAGGQINFNNGFTQTTSGVTNIKLTGTAPSEFGRVSVTGALTLGGTLNVTAGNGFQPGLTDVFPVATFDSRVGDFATKNLPTLGQGVMLETLYAPNTLVLAAGLVVDSTLDTVDANLGDGQPKDASGNATLRAAIMEANSLVGPQTIILPVGTYTLSLAGADEDNALTGDLDIKDDLTIIGAGAASTFIDAADLDRIFLMSSPANDCEWKESRFATGC